jgi:antitoxin YefM
MAMTTTSLADAKNRLSEIVAAAETTHERTVVTKNGRPAAVIIGVDDYESLLETLSILRNPTLTASLLTPLDPDDTVDASEVFADLRARTAQNKS